MLYLLINRINVVSEKYFRFLSCAAVLILLRLFVSCEISGLQTNVYPTRIYPEIYLFLTRPLAAPFGWKLSIASILTAVSLTGSIVCGERIALSNYTVSRVLKRYRAEDNGMMGETVADINWGGGTSFRIVQSMVIPAPFIFGLRRPVIFLPKIDLPKEEWHYILSHKIAHYYSRDL